MFLLEMLFLSFVIALLRGGRIGRLADLNFRWPWLLVLALFLKFSVYFPFGQSYYDFVSAYSAPRHLLSYMLIVVFLLLNLHLRSFASISLGIFLNFIAIVVNGGFMPASRVSLIKSGLGELVPHYLQNGGYWNNSVLMSSKTHLNVLGDLFYLPLPAPFYSVFSIGDILIGIGIFFFIQQAMLARGFDWSLRGKLLTHKGKP